MESNPVPSRLTAIALAFMAVIWVSPFSWLFLNAFDTACDPVRRAAPPVSGPR